MGVGLARGCAKKIVHRVGVAGSKFSCPATLLPERKTDNQCPGSLFYVAVLLKSWEGDNFDRMYVTVRLPVFSFVDFPVVNA